MNIGEVCYSLAVQRAKIQNSFRSENSFELMLSRARSEAEAADTADISKNAQLNEKFLNKKL